MRKEVESAVDFLTKILRTRKVKEESVDNFNTTLVNLICSHYENHWFPDKPFKGSAYRCIRIYQKMDVLIQEAGEKAGISVKQLFEFLPNELTMWIDPLEVSYRIGEDGSVGTLYEDKEGKDALKAANKAAKAQAQIVRQQQQQSAMAALAQQKMMEQQSRLVSQSSTGESPHSSPSSSPPPGFSMRSSPLRLSPVNLMTQQQQMSTPPTGAAPQRQSPVNFFHPAQHQQPPPPPQNRRSPTQQMQGALRGSPQQHHHHQGPLRGSPGQSHHHHQHPPSFHHHAASSHIPPPMVPGAMPGHSARFSGRMSSGPGEATASGYQQQSSKQPPFPSMMGVAPLPQQQHTRQSPVNILQHQHHQQRKTPSPIMTADDFLLHKQQQEQFMLHEQELQETNEFLQACRDQLRYYLSADSTNSDSMNMENLLAATTFVAS